MLIGIRVDVHTITIHQFVHTVLAQKLDRIDGAREKPSLPRLR